MFLGTVRRKLTALVAFSALAAFVILPMLWWLMHRELIDEVHTRVPEAIKGFDEELGDDLKDLDVTAIAISGEANALNALAARDQEKLGKVAEPFRQAYPDLDMLFYDPSGKLVAQFGCDAPQAVMPKLALDKHVILPHGCEAGEVEPIAVAFVRAIGDAGFLLVCLPLDKNYFANAQRKIGGEIALEVTDPAQHGGARMVAHSTIGFPVTKLDAATPHGKIVDGEGGTTWAIAWFDPTALATADHNQIEMRFSAALDVTEIKHIVRKHLLVALAIVCLATTLSVAFGWRLASRMSQALTRVSTAMRRLEQQEYVKVDMLRTGDELEDLAEGFNSMVDGLRERDKLRVTMGKYMTEELLQHVMAGEVELGGKTLDITIMFCDLRDFTTLSEKRSAQEIVGLLNEYFTEMVDCVMAEGGVVDKYIGDNIMAVFGAPVTRPDDALRAVRAAVRMRDALVNLNNRFAARGLSKLRFGIGLHSGEVVAGNIGSAKRMEYTVIGDAVNVASRLESKTKELGTDILISDATHERVKAGVSTEAIGEVTVKGRAQAVQIYKVTGIIGA